MYHFSLTFLHIVLSNVSSYYLPERMHSYTGCICLPFLRCVFSNVSSKRLHERMQSHIVAFVWLFSTVRFQMCSHEGDLRWHLKNHNGEKSNKCNQCDLHFLMKAIWGDIWNIARGTTDPEIESVTWDVSLENMYLFWYLIIHVKFYFWARLFSQ